MTTGGIIRMILQGLVFLAWAGFMFKTLYTLSARDKAQGGGPFPSTGGFMTQLKYWLSSEQDRQERRLLFFLTAVLLIMNVTNMLAIQAAEGL